MDFRSDKLWIQYIDWEVAANELLRASQIYDVLLGTPTLGYQTHFERYKEFVAAHEPDQILSTQEYESISDRVYDAIKHQLDGPMYFVEEYEEEVLDSETNDEPPTKRQAQRRRHAEPAIAEFRAEILNRRTKLFLTNESAISTRMIYEKAVSSEFLQT